MDEATHEPKAWKKKRKGAIKVSFGEGEAPGVGSGSDSSVAALVSARIGDRSDEGRSSTSPPGGGGSGDRSDEMPGDGRGIAQSLVPTHWPGSGKPVDDSSILAIGRAAEAAARKLKHSKHGKGTGSHADGEVPAADGGGLTMADRPNAAR